MSHHPHAHRAGGTRPPDRTDALLAYYRDEIAEADRATPDALVDYAGTFGLLATIGPDGASYAWFPGDEGPTAIDTWGDVALLGTRLLTERRRAGAAR